MGRFDALTQIEEKPQKPALLSVVSPPASEKSSVQHIKTKDKVKKPANPQTGKPANPQTDKTEFQPNSFKIVEYPEKYSTRLEPSMVRKIKVYAAEKDLKDYEVVKISLSEYFQRNK